MQHSYIDHRSNVQKNRSNIQKNNFKNYVKISSEIDQFGKIAIELNYMNNNKIFIRTFNITKDNLNPTLKKLKERGFEIRLTESNSNSNTIAPTMVNTSHPEYINNRDFRRSCYQDSFNQKFN